MNNKHRYPINWNDTIRPAILSRDNYKCQQCGIKHRTKGFYDAKKQFVATDAWLENYAKENHFKIQTIHLQIAHINQNPSDNNYENLKAMCPKCHLTFDNQFNKLKRLQRKIKPTH